MPGIYSALAALIDNNKPACHATVIRGEPTGSHLLISAEGIVAGAIHPEIDSHVAAAALAMLAIELSETRVYTIAGKEIEVFIETFPPPQRLIIIGAVHVAIPLHKLAKMLGYHVTLIDAREALATPARFPVADSILVAWPDDAISAIGLDRGTSVVVLTHDPKFDHPALLAAIRSEAHYIGAIGSRTTNMQRMQALREQGASEEQLARIYAPVGLDIGAQTPSEIALAIIAELVAARRGHAGGHLTMR